MIEPGAPIIEAEVDNADEAVDEERLTGTTTRRCLRCGGLFLRRATQSTHTDGFPDLDAVENRLHAFQDHYNTTACPFDWTFTRDLNELLDRLGRHDLHAPRPEVA